MKTNYFPALLAVSLGGLVLIPGCSRQEEPASTAVATPPAASTPAVPAEAPKPAEAVKAVADTAVTEATKAQESLKSAAPTAAPLVAAAPESASAPTATAAGTSAVQGILEHAKTLMAEKKYPEALNALSAFGNLNLSAEQQKLLTELKSKISNAMAAQAGNEALKSVGGLLKK
jgi:hypothetical protein